MGRGSTQKPPVMCSQAQQKPWRWERGCSQRQDCGSLADPLAHFILIQNHFDSAGHQDTKMSKTHCPCPPAALRPKGNKHANKSIPRESLEMTWGGAQGCAGEEAHEIT